MFAYVCIPGSLLSIMWLAWASITFETESWQQTVLNRCLCSAALPVATLFQRSHMESQQLTAKDLKGTQEYPGLPWIHLRLVYELDKRKSSGGSVWQSLDIHAFHLNQAGERRHRRATTLMLPNACLAVDFPCTSHQYLIHFTERYCIATHFRIAIPRAVVVGYMQFHSLLTATAFRPVHIWQSAQQPYPLWSFSAGHRQIPWSPPRIQV